MSEGIMNRLQGVAPVAPGVWLQVFDERRTMKMDAEHAATGRPSFRAVMASPPRLE
jgi:hypothetical protein